MILKKFKNRFLTSCALLLLVILILNYSFFLLYTLIVLGILSIIEFFEIIKKIFKKVYLKIIFNFLFIIFIFIFAYIFFFFSHIPQLKIILFILLFGCIASDIGGFIIGNIFKGPKLTRISPKKTISGALGSIFFSIVVISLFVFYTTKMFSINTIAISILTSLGCQIGDLFFSFLKRRSKIKDTGNILPGHGGILDRLDGIFFGIPIGFIALIILY